MQLEFANIRPVLCFSIALLLLGGSVSSPISFWISYNQNAFAQESPDTTPPTVVSAATASTTTIDVTFSEPIVDNITTPATPGDFVIGGVATTTLVTGVSASGSVLTLTLDQPMTDADVPTVAYTQSVGTIDDLAVPANSLATFTAQPVTNNLDTTAPTFVSAATSSTTTIDVTFSEPIVDNIATPATPGDFVIAGVATLPLVTSLSASGSVLTLTLDQPMTGADVPTVAYTPTIGSIDDLAVPSNSLVSFTAQPVTNNLPPGRSGGPDHLGYTFIDSNSQGGPTFDWIEIRDTGTRLPQLDNGDDKVQSNVPIGFTFNYYGIRKSLVDVTTNGLVLSPGDEDATRFSNVPIGDPNPPNNFLAPFWDDLFVHSPGAVFSQTIGTAPNRIFVVEWVDVQHFSSTPSGVTFEAILNEGSNDIKFQYLHTAFGDGFNDNGASATVGIESADGRGLQYSFEEPVLFDNLAILFNYPSVLPPLPPVTVDDSAATTVNTPVTIDVLANDYDPNNDAISISVFDTFAEEGGTISIDGASLTYAPPQDFVGTDTFTYQISDGNEGTSTGTVAVHVLSVKCNQPDFFGYTCTDSNSQGGTTFNWIDLTSTGTRIENLDGEDDEFVEGIQIGFPFKFYGTDHTDLAITTNGLALANSEDSDEPESFSNEPIGDSGDVSNFIAPFWDDLALFDDDGDDAGAIYYKTLGEAPNRQFVVEWFDIPHCCSSPSGITFEAILYEGTNDIRFQYLDVDFGDPDVDNGASATVGIESPHGRGLQYSFDEPALINNLAILFKNPSVLPSHIGTVNFIGSLDHDSKGLAFVGTDLYSISPFDGDLRKIDPSNGQTISSIPIDTCNNECFVRGGNGLATNPITGELWALVKQSGAPGRKLVIIEPSTGQATLMGATGGKFAGLAFDSAGTLYGVTGAGAGDGPGNPPLDPDKLYTISTDGLATTSPFLKVTGEEFCGGETIAFNSADGFLYHASGGSCDDAIFEKIDLVRRVISSIDTSDTPISDNEVTALAWVSGHTFLWASFSSLFEITVENPTELDTTAPTFVSAVTTSTTTIDVTFSEPIVDNGATAGDFVIAGVASTPTVTGLSASGAVLTLTLDHPMTDADTPTVEYTATIGSIDDLAVPANSLASFTAQSVTNNLDTTPPVITLLGQSTVTVETGSTYEDAGARALDNIGGNLTLSIVTVNPVNTGVVGTYTVTYDVTDAAGNHATQVTRTVHVVSLVSFLPVDVTLGFTVPEGTAVVTPVTAESPTSEHGLLISFLGGIVDITLTSGSCVSGCPIVFTFTDDDLAAAGISDLTSIRILEDHSGTGTGFVPLDTTILDGAPSPYTVSATTFSNSLFGVGVIGPDTIPPVITLLGANQVTVSFGSTYVDAGATALDNLDGDISANIIATSTVDTSLVGTYTVTYDVTDAAGNHADQVSRTVFVVDSNAGRIDLSAPTLTPGQLETITTQFQAIIVESGTNSSITTTTDMPPIIVAGIGNAVAIDEAIRAQSTLQINANFTSGTTGAAIIEQLNITPYTMPESNQVVVVLPPIVTPPDDVNGQIVTTPPLNTVVPGQRIIIPVETSVLADAGVKEIDLQSSNTTTSQAAATEYLTLEVNKQIPSAASVPDLSTVSSDKLSLFIHVKYPHEETGGTTGFDWSNAANFDHPPRLTLQIPKPAAGSGIQTDPNGCQISKIYFIDPSTGSWTPETVAVPSSTSLDDTKCETVVEVQHFSKFAIGGVKSVLFLAGLGGDAGGAGPSVSQFSVTTENQAGFAAILELDPNKPHTNVVDTFDPSTVTMRLSHPEGASSVKHVGIYLDLGGIFREVANSDTYIVWDKNNELQVVDPQGFMKDVDLKVTTVGKSLQLKLSLTFVKPMPKSDVLVRTWDADMNTRNIRYKDAVQIVPPQTISPESKVPVFVKNNAKFWADGQITDDDFTKGIQYLIQQNIMIVPTPTVSGTTTPSVTGTTSPIISGTTTAPGIPAWIKNNAKWWSEDQITEKDFLSGIQYLIAQGIIKAQ